MGRVFWIVEKTKSTVDISEKHPKLLIIIGSFLDLFWGINMTIHHLGDTAGATLPSLI